MAQWRNLDNAANSPIWSAALVGKSVTTANQTAEFGNTIFGVSKGEQAAKRAAGGSRAAHAGWVKKTVGTGGRAGRVMYETLVAMKSISGDGSDDSTFFDYLLRIVTQPAASNSPAKNAISFSVVANSTPSGATLAYTWQTTNGSSPWISISDAGTYMNSNTATLNIANNSIVSGNVFRVIVQATGADNVVSQNASVAIY